MRRNPDRHTKGFTLIELMLVVAILGLLSSMAIPKFADLVIRAKEAGTKGRLGGLRSAITIYYTDNEALFPMDLKEGLTAGQKYLSEIPVGDFPPYHRGNEVDNWMGPVTHEPSLTSKVVWAYSSPAIGNSSNSGEITPYCLHPDSRGKAWNSY